jgi:hypothetical protein
MRRLHEIVRIAVVSPESVCVLAVVVGAYHWPGAFAFVGEKFASNTKLWEFIPAIPLGVLSFAVYLSFQLHAPEEGAKRELYDWDLHWALKYRIVAALIWSGVSGLSSLAVWFASTDLPSALVGAIFVASFAVSVTVAATEVLALFSLREILAK